MVDEVVQVCPWNLRRDRQILNVVLESLFLVVADCELLLVLLHATLDSLKLRIIYDSRRVVLESDAEDAGLVLLILSSFGEGFFESCDLPETSR